MATISEIIKSFQAVAQLGPKLWLCSDVCAHLSLLLAKQKVSKTLLTIFTPTPLITLSSFSSPHPEF